MTKLLEMLQQDFMLRVLAGTMLVGGVCSYLGVFVVLRRAVFVGAALAQVSSLGVALALLAGTLAGASAHGHSPAWAWPSALVLTVIAALLMAGSPREQPLPRETAVGIIYAAAGALAILAVALCAGGEAQVMNLLFGNVLTISRSALAGLALLVLAVGLLHAVCYRRFLFVSFDPDMATALGLRARAWNALLFVSIGVTVALAIRAAGALVVFGFLVLPAAVALLLGRTLRAVIALSLAAGLVSALAGVTASYLLDLPTGPAIVAAAVLLWIAVAAGRRCLARG